MDDVVTDVKEVTNDNAVSTGGHRQHYFNLITDDIVNDIADVTTVRDISNDTFSAQYRYVSNFSQ